MLSYHTASHCGTAQAVVLSETCTTELQGEQVGNTRLPHQRVKEGLKILIRLKERKGKEIENERRIKEMEEKRKGKEM